jgi:hypothetical protein
MNKFEIIFKVCLLCALVWIALSIQNSRTEFNFPSHLNVTIDNDVGVRIKSTVDTVILDGRMEIKLDGMDISDSLNLRSR